MSQYRAGFTGVGAPSRVLRSYALSTMCKSRAADTLTTRRASVHPLKAQPLKTLFSRCPYTRCGFRLPSHGRNKGGNDTQTNIWVSFLKERLAFLSNFLPPCLPLRCAKEPASTCALRRAKGGVGGEESGVGMGEENRERERNVGGGGGERERERWGGSMHESGRWGGVQGRIISLI